LNPEPHGFSCDQNSIFVERCYSSYMTLPAYNRG
jgi:hypothetical protein